MKPVIRLVSSLLLRSSTSEQAKSAAFILKTAEEVMHLRRESGVSQVLHLEIMAVKVVYLFCCK